MLFIDSCLPDLVAVYRFTEGASIKRDYLNVKSISAAKYPIKIVFFF